MTSRKDATESSDGSNNSNLKIKPNVRFCLGFNIGDAYKVALNYDKIRESHLMKNSEWGAVAYLTHSQYGRNGHKIDINNSNSRITGNGGGSPGASEQTGTPHPYTTKEGAGASTTGNIYGIYDLSGGYWEILAAYISNGHQHLTQYGGGVFETTADVNGYQTKSTKYVTVYPYNASSDKNTDNYSTYKKIAEDSNGSYGYGDAILETSTSGSDFTSWFGETSAFANGQNMFFARGSYYASQDKAGIFYFGPTDATGNSTGFRLVLPGV